MYTKMIVRRVGYRGRGRKQEKGKTEYVHDEDSEGVFGNES